VTLEEEGADSNTSSKSNTTQTSKKDSSSDLNMSGGDGGGPAAPPKKKLPMGPALPAELAHDLDDDEFFKLCVGPHRACAWVCGRGWVAMFTQT
jgi:hypothetical protein